MGAVDSQFNVCIVDMKSKNY